MLFKDNKREGGTETTGMPRNSFGCGAVGASEMGTMRSYALGVWCESDNRKGFGVVKLEFC